jgi:arylsulfatase A-like enzyme
LHSYNIWVTSDHGFSTHTGAIDVDRVLEPFARTRPDGRPSIIQRGGAIYLENEGEAEVSAIVRALQRTPGVGAIFTRATQSGSFDGHVPGTLSFEAARWTHDRAADVLFSPDWTDAANLHGMRGTTASEGTAGHGSSSPWDIHNTLIAAGPDLKRGVTVDTPSANVDFMPTILRLSGLSIPSSVQGRVLEEALIDGASIRADEVRTLAHTARTADGSYAVTGTFSVVVIDGRQYRYFDGTRVVRK